MAARAKQSKPEKPPRGLYIHRYALDLLRERKITHRGMLLLAHVDNWINTSEGRWFEYPNDPAPDRRHWISAYKQQHLDPSPDAIWMTVPLLKCWLRATDDTVRATIQSLIRVEPRIFGAKRLKKRSRNYAWAMKTQKRDYEKGSLFVPGPVLKLWETERIKGNGMLVLSYVESFARGEKRVQRVSTCAVDGSCYPMSA